MAQAPVFSKGRDLDSAATALRPWLAERLGVGNVELAGFSYPSGAGVSNETILFEARWPGGVEELVLRAEPRRDYQLFLETEFGMQYDLLATLHRGERVRVPEVLWFEDDSAVLGERFFIMRRMRGRVPVTMPLYNASGWLFDATPQQRRTLWENAMRQFAAIHCVRVDDVAMVDRPALGRNGVAQQLTYWTRYASWALGDDVPEVVTTLLAWLTEHVPDEPPGLSWGDARIGNMMFGDDFDVVGVMDWEQASLAGGASDLGWWLMCDAVHSVDRGYPRLEGLGTRQETIDLWEQLTGLRADNLLWHEVFACCKTGLLSLRTRQLMNLADVEQLEQSPYLARACRLLDLAPPTPPA